MPEKVLIYSRFPKAMMVRIGQHFDLMDAAGKPPGEVFTAEQERQSEEDVGGD